MLKTSPLLFALCFLCSISQACSPKDNQSGLDSVDASNQTQTPMNDDLQLATFGNGCFWCTEAIFLQVEGVEKAVSGYSGGHVKNPTYREVCNKTTGHAEVVQLSFDPKRISYEELLEIFWKTHDPTTKDRQGNDVGPQYRSVIFFHNEEQQEKAEFYKEKLDKEGIWENPIVTEIEPMDVFYPAEDYHQDYYALNKNANPYCTMVITPKVDKFKKVFKDKMKK